MLKDILRQIDHSGLKASVVSVDRLVEMRQDLAAFTAGEDLNGFQRFIIDQMYQLGLPDCGFTVQSVIIVAMPVPAWAEVVFFHDGRQHRVRSAARWFPGGLPLEIAVNNVLSAALAQGGYHFAPAQTLPLKRLAACSGLARYGRNNITYVEGMGSFHTLAAYYSDLPVEEEQWHAPALLARCESCAVCRNNCPTGAIRPDRFLIDNERCLSFFNEAPGQFPDWLPVSAHHCLYDCLRCQEACPENKLRLGDVVGPIEFDERETGALLAGTPLEGFSLEAQQKIRLLGMDQWIAAIPRNMMILMNNQQESPT